MDRDKLFNQVVRLRQQVESEQCTNLGERYSCKAIAATLHALSSAIHYGSELELQRQINQFMFDELIRAAEKDDRRTG